MPSTTATRTSTASAEPQGSARPRIGLLGVMQALYDDMLPGITERQAAYAAAVGEALGGVCDVVVGDPVKDRADVEVIYRGLSVLTQIPHAAHLEVAHNEKIDQIANDIDVIVYGEFATIEDFRAYKAHRGEKTTSLTL